MLSLLSMLCLRPSNEMTYQKKKKPKNKNIFTHTRETKQKISRPSNRFVIILALRRHFVDSFRVQYMFFSHSGHSLSLPSRTKNLFTASLRDSVTKCVKQVRVCIPVFCKQKKAGFLDVFFECPDQPSQWLWHSGLVGMQLHGFLCMCCRCLEPKKSK